MIVSLFEKKIEAYKSIDTMPISNWFKFHESGDLRYFSMHDIFEHDLKLKEAKELNAAHEKVMSEFIDTFGISETYKRILDLRSEITWLKFDMLRLGDNTIQNLIDVCEIELNELLNSSHKVKYSEVVSYVENEMGFIIQENEVSVKKYYSWLKLINDKAKNGKNN